MKYLFECYFNDGTIIKQTSEDISCSDPSKSAFFDVHQKLHQIIYFGLYGSGHMYVVDLRDGHFEIDGVPFRIDGAEPSTLELIYFRRNFLMIKDGDVLSHVSFHMGWKGMVDGSEVCKTITVF